MQLCGCSTTSPSSRAAPAANAIDRIQHQMSIEELRSALAEIDETYLPLRHHWTAGHDGREVMLISARVNPASPFCFLFLDQRLGAIIEANFGSIRSIEGSLEAAMAAEALTIEEFRARCQQQLARYEHARESMEFNIALAPMLLFDRTGANRRQYLKLMHEFDATRVRLKMTRAQTDALFGGPSKLSRTATQQIITYGREVDLDSFPAPLVSIAFADGVAVWVKTDYRAPAMVRRSPER